MGIQVGYSNEPSSSESIEVKNEIRFTVTSDGTTGEEWIKRLKKKGFFVSGGAVNFLLSSDFSPTKGIAHEVVIIKGSFWGTDGERTAVNIRKEAHKRKLATPNAEVACLLREKFTDPELQAMGFSWVVCMHKPRKLELLGAGGSPNLSGRWLDSLYVKLHFEWTVDIGFAFVLPQG